MLKYLTVAVATFFLTVAVPSGAQAGVFELFGDDISTSCDTDIEPCRHNNIGYATRYVHGRLLRYGIHTTPARYVWRRERVMVLPPRVAYDKAHYRTQKVGRKRLLVADGSSYHVVAPATYTTVLRRVLVAPATNRVIRLRPHSAYFADTIIVKGGCKRPLSHLC
jgi:hypothetical protein